MSESEAFWNERFENADESVALAEPSEQAEEPLTRELTSLLTVGRLTKTLDIGGNEVVLRTLKSGEELEIGLLTKPYIGTNEQDRSYIIAVLAASIVTINGKPIVTALGPEDGSILSRKFSYLQKNYYWHVLREIYNGYLELMREQIKAFEELMSK
jgi:hypothetical protein